MHTPFKTLLNLFLFILSCSIVHASQSETVSFMLENGLKVIIRPDHRAPVAVVQIWYKTGSANESPGKRGISHLLEHMMFKSHNNPQLAQDFWQLTRIGAKRNAFTHRDYTFYFYIADKAALPRMLHLEAERMQGLYASEKSLIIEKKIIREEFNNQLSKDPFYFLDDLIYQKAFPDSGYQYPIIGNFSDIQKLSLQQLSQWHRQYYTPDNAVLVVAGDVNASEVFHWADRYFSPITKRRDSSINPQITLKTSHPSTPRSEIHYILPHRKDSSTSTGKLLMGFRVPSIKTAVPQQDAYALEVLAGWLDSGVHSRLPRALIWDKQKAQDISVRYGLMTRYDSLFIIEAMPLKDISMTQLEQAIKDELKTIRQQLISERELQEVKNQMIAAEVFERDSTYTQAKIIGQAEVIDIPWSEDAKYIERIKSVTAEQVQKVLNKYFTANNRITIIQP